MRRRIPLLFVGLLAAAHLAGCAAPPAVRQSAPAAAKAPHLLLNEQGHAAFQKSDFEGAASAYRDALKWAPKDPVLWGNLGDASLRAGRYGEAIEAYGRSLEISPGVPEVRARRGEALYAAGRFAEAVRDFTEVLEEKDSPIPEVRGEWLRRKAFAHAGLGEAEAAFAAIDKAREAAPAYDSRNDLALIHYALGNREKAWQFRGGRGMVGMEVQDYKKEGESGALVIRTSENGPARRAGILDGDVVVHVNGAPVASAADLVRLASALVPGATARVGVLREGRPRSIPLIVGSSESLIESSPLIAPILAKRREAAKPRPAAAAPQMEAPPAPSAAPGEALPPPRADAYAVVIGIDYEGRPDIPRLRYASEDARRIYELLTDPRYGGVPRENAQLILNEKATRSELIAALRRIRTWNGYITVFYSGHGAPRMKDGQLTDALLVPYDIVVTDPGAMEETGIRLSYLRELVDDSRAKGVLVALDACFSGGGKSIVPQGSRPLVGVAVSPELIRPKGMGKVILTSSALSQQSWEDESELKGGIFSHALREGLGGRAGKDSWVTADELATYVRSEVPRAARRLKGVDQEPQVVGTGSFPVARNWEKARFLDADRARERLKTAFEQRLINADQLKRALGELGRPSLSRTLEAFLEERIDGRNFGELY